MKLVVSILFTPYRSWFPLTLQCNEWYSSGLNAMQVFKVTIKPFLASSTSKERLEQEIQDFLNEELYIEEEPDTPIVIIIEAQ